VRIFAGSALELLGHAPAVRRDSKRAHGTLRAFGPTLLREESIGWSPPTFFKSPSNKQGAVKQEAAKKEAAKKEAARQNQPPESDKE